MSFAAAQMDLEINILSQKVKYHMILLKTGSFFFFLNDTNEVINKTKSDSLTQRMSIQLPEKRGSSKG